MAFYLLLILVCLLGYILIPSERRATLLAFFLLTLVSALRAETVGVDTPQFVGAFREISEGEIGQFLARYEVGFVLLCKGLSFVTKSPSALVGMTSAFVNASYLRFLYRHSKDLKMSTVLYIFTNIFFMNMNVMRQAVATAILLFGFSALLSESRYAKLKYAVALFFATLFHTVSLASLLLLPTMFLLKKRWGAPLLFVGFFALYLGIEEAFFLFNRLLGNRYDGYLGGEFLTGNLFGSLLLFLLPFSLFVFLYALRIFLRGSLFWIKEKNAALTAATLVFLLLSLLVTRMNIVERAANLFLPFLLLSLPAAANAFRASPRLYGYARFFVLTAYFSSFTVIAAFRPEWYGVIPYRPFFYQIF